MKSKLTTPNALMRNSNTVTKGDVKINGGDDFMSQWSEFERLLGNDIEVNMSMKGGKICITINSAAEDLVRIMSEISLSQN